MKLLLKVGEGGAKRAPGAKLKSQCFLSYTKHLAGIFFVTM